MTTPDARTPADDLTTLIDQVHAGVVFCAEQLDERHPGWERNKTVMLANTDAYRNAWGLLQIAWINLGTALIRDHDQPAWTIPPLPGRDTDGTRTLTQFGPDGTVDITPTTAVPDPERNVQPGTIRRVNHPTEPRYTLDEARRLLDICQQHHWEVDLAADGTPRGIRCTTDGCTERRPLR